MEYEAAKALFLDQLVEKSRLRRILWQEDADEDSFSVTLSGKYTARVSRNKTRTIYLKILNESGTELFRYSERADEPAGTVWDLFESAKRKALNVDEALTELLNDIDQH